MTLTERLARLCAGDGEFRLASRHWTGTLRLDLGTDAADLRLRDGAAVEVVVAEGQQPAGPGHVGISGSADLWEKVLAPVPERFFNDVVPAQLVGLAVSGDQETFWQYYPAIRRVVEMLRQDVAAERSG